MVSAGVQRLEQRCADKRTVFGMGDSNIVRPVPGAMSKWALSGQSDRVWSIGGSRLPKPREYLNSDSLLATELATECDSFTP